MTFIVVSRPGHPYDIPEGAKVVPLNSMELTVSSSAIRAELADGHRLNVLPQPVLDYIRGNKLYKR